MVRSLELPVWPDGADVCVSLTFDVDAHVGAAWRGIENKITSMSEMRYGLIRGLPRILGTLDRLGIRGTFYVPGEIAEKHPGAVQDIVSAGHEVGHHGFSHLMPDVTSGLDQQDEVRRGLDVLGSVLRAAPAGYRCPGWELTAETFELVHEAGFRYDSSCMGDDRPYVEEQDGLSILEFPVHWSLDDWVYFLFSRDRGGVMADPEVLYHAWHAEFQCAVRERRMVTYTMHPEAMGRGYRMVTLERLVDQMRSEAKVWFATHGEVADLLELSSPSVEGKVH